MIKRDFTDEQQMFRQSFRRFLEQEIAPHMEGWNEQGLVDRSTFTKAGANGFLCTWAEEEYGDLDFRFEQIIIEETQYALCGDWHVSLHTKLVAPYLKRFGTDAQQARYLPKVVSGECILAIAMTEPDAGSDLAGMRSTAIDQGDHYLLNGSKTFISNGINSDLVIVAAKIDPVNNPRALSLFLVERGMEGFERGANLKKMGKKARILRNCFSTMSGCPRKTCWEKRVGACTI